MADRPFSGCAYEWRRPWYGMCMESLYPSSNGYSFFFCKSGESWATGDACILVLEIIRTYAFDRSPFLSP